MHFIIRPKAILYITYSLIKYIFLFGLLSVAAFAIVDGKPFSTDRAIEIVAAIFLIIMSVMVLVLVFLQTREIIRYKMVVTDDKLYMAANRDLFLKRHEDIIMDYEGITAVQYRKSLRPDLIQKGMFFFFCIYVKRNTCQKEEYLPVMWFSKKQVDFIIRQICAQAEIINGYAVEVLPEVIE